MLFPLYRVFLLFSHYATSARGQVTSLDVIFMDVYNRFWCLGQIFIPKPKCHKEKSHKGSI